MSILFNACWFLVHIVCVYVVYDNAIMIYITFVCFIFVGLVGYGRHPKLDILGRFQLKIVITSVNMCKL